jgi:photosystem II stability/assembly factor-like uncharacterized protein
MHNHLWTGQRETVKLAAASALAAAVVAAGALLGNGGNGGNTAAAQSDQERGAAGHRTAPPAHKPDREVAPAKRAPNAIGFWSRRRGLIGKQYARSRTGGRVLLTTDGGKTFEVVLRTKAGVASIDTAGTEDAWVVTQRRQFRQRVLLHSGDGGHSWARVSADPPIVPSFSTSRDGIGMEFPRDGVAGVPNSKHVLITDDGGGSWSRVKSPCSARRIGGSVVTGAIVAMATPTDALAVCVGEGYVGMQPKEIRRTEDGGQSWEKVTDDESCDGPIGICRVGFVGGITLDENGAGALTGGDYAYLTWDLGETWSHRRTESWPRFSSALAAQPVSQRAVVALVFGGCSVYRLIATYDRGDRWHLLRKWRRGRGCGHGRKAR